MSVTHTRPENRAAVGKTIGDLARASGRAPIDVFLDLALSEELKTGVKIHDFANRDQDALATMLKHPNAVIGLSDGGAHTKLFSLGKYPIEFLAHWIRDRELLSRVVERFPQVKAVVLESQASWIGYLLDRYGKASRKGRTNPRP